MKRYTRKEVACKLGIGIDTLRYYEKRGLIEKPERDSNGYRKYSEKDTTKIDHVLRIKNYGFTLKEIKEFLEIPNPSPKDIKRIVRLKISKLETEISNLESKKNSLIHFLESF